MFNRINRLPQRRIKLVYRKGKKHNGRGFIIHQLNNEVEVPRFTVVVSKKVHKHAVVRNRYKRVFREALKQLTKDGHIPSDDYILTVLPHVWEDITSEKAYRLVKNSLMHNEI